MQLCVTVISKVIEVIARCPYAGIWKPRDVSKTHTWFAVALPGVEKLTCSISINLHLYVWRDWGTTSCRFGHIRHMCFTCEVMSNIPAYGCFLAHRINCRRAPTRNTCCQWWSQMPWTQITQYSQHMWHTWNQNQTMPAVLLPQLNDQQQQQH